MDPDFSIDARTRLLDQIVVSDMQAELDTNVITLFPPQLATAYGRNTRVPVKVHKGDVLVNSFAAYITRFTLTDVLSPLGIPKEILLGLVNTHEVLPLLNTTYGINLTTDDVLFELFVDNDSTITANPLSYGFIGTYDFNKAIVLRTVDENLMQLNGLYWGLNPGIIIEV